MLPATWMAANRQASENEKARPTNSSLSTRPASGRTSSGMGLAPPAGGGEGEMADVVGAAGVGGDRVDADREADRHDAAGARREHLRREERREDEQRRDAGED